MGELSFGLLLRGLVVGIAIVVVGVVVLVGDDLVGLVLIAAGVVLVVVTVIVAKFGFQAEPEQRKRGGTR